MIYGETTEEFTIFAACDSVYLWDHGKGFVCSCALAKNNVHIHVSSASGKDRKYLKFLEEGYKILYPDGHFTSSYDEVDLGGKNAQERKTYFACNRFLIADQVIKCDVLILDIDCFLMSHIEPFDGDVGLFFRERRKDASPWNEEGNLVAAGAVYCSKHHLDFFSKVKEIINENDFKWFLDQVALIRAYQVLNDKKYITIGEKFLDWSFRKNSKIWTGKGTKKSLDPTYSAKHKEFRKKFPISEKNYDFNSILFT